MALSPHRRRMLVGTLLAAGCLLCLALTVLAAYESSVRLRVDTAVPGIAEGADGCVTGARFTALDGTEHLVDVRSVRGTCRSGRPGDRITVWYDVADPAVNAASGRCSPAAFAAACARACVRTFRGLPVAERATGPVITEAATPYHWDRVTGRLDLLLGQLDEEGSRPEAERTTRAGDRSLRLVRADAERTLALLQASDLPAAVGGHRRRGPAGPTVLGSGRTSEQGRPDAGDPRARPRRPSGWVTSARMA